MKKSAPTRCAAHDVTCPAGHPSDESDYCSVCGARHRGRGARLRLAQAPAPRRIAARRPLEPACPVCGEPRADLDARFCEVCRYDFVERAGPPPEARRGRAALAARAPASRAAWQLVLTVDPSLDTEPDPAAPPPAEPERIFPVEQPEMLVGRRDDRQNIRPAVPLHDPGRLAPPREVPPRRGRRPCPSTTWPPPTARSSTARTSSPGSDPSAEGGRRGHARALDAHPAPGTRMTVPASPAHDAASHPRVRRGRVGRRRSSSSSSRTRPSAPTAPRSGPSRTRAAPNIVAAQELAAHLADLDTRARERAPRQRGGPGRRERALRGTTLGGQPQARRRRERDRPRRSRPRARRRHERGARAVPGGRGAHAVARAGGATGTAR